MSQPSSRANDLVSEIVGFDATRALKTLELISLVADPDNDLTSEVQKLLYVETEDFKRHFQDFINRL